MDEQTLKSLGEAIKEAAESAADDSDDSGLGLYNAIIEYARSHSMRPDLVLSVLETTEVVVIINMVKFGMFKDGKAGALRAYAATHAYNRRRIEALEG